MPRMACATVLPASASDSSLWMFTLAAQPNIRQRRVAKGTALAVSAGLLCSPASPRLGLHGAERQRQTTAAAATRADERALFVERQAGCICAEVVPEAAVQILLDV